MTIETQLNVGDTVWMIKGGIPTKYVIDDIQITYRTRISIWYSSSICRKPKSFSNRWGFSECRIGDSIFLTRQELLESLKHEKLKIEN